MIVKNTNFCKNNCVTNALKMAIMAIIVKDRSLLYKTNKQTKGCKRDHVTLINACHF